jgi:Cu/Ag efflux protein CusF
MSRSILGASLVLAIFGATPLLAQQPTQPPASGGGLAVGTTASARATATVEAIDQKTREVTLRKEDGELVTLVVSEEARNLPQVVKGDRVTVVYKVGLVVALGPPGKEPVRVEDTKAAGGVIQETIAVTATVVGIDPTTRVVTLKGPRQTLALPVASDIDLSKIKLGDQVGAVYQQSLALNVEAAK